MTAVVPGGFDAKSAASERGPSESDGESPLFPHPSDEVAARMAKAMQAALRVLVVAKLPKVSPPE